MSDSPGLLDTNVFVHAHTKDELSGECRAFLKSVESGTRKAALDPLVLHELSYALPHYLKGMSRSEVADYLLMILSWPGTVADKGVLLTAVEYWRDAPRLAFVDAYLATLALERDCAVFSKNVKELVRLGVSVPNPLPHS